MVKRHLKLAAIACTVMVALGPGRLSAASKAVPDTATLSKADQRNARAAFQAIKKKRWTQVGGHTRKITSPLLRKTLYWLDLARPNSDASFDDIAGFLDANPAWPSNWALRRRGEEAMTAAIDPAKVLGWFDDNAAITVDGKMRLIAALTVMGRNDEAQAKIRDVWINGDFGRRQEKTFYRKYRRQLSADDHAARLDRLLWEGKFRSTRRMLWKFKGAERALAEARFMLRHRRGNVDRAIAHVPKTLRLDPGLVFERAKWRRRKGRFKDAFDVLAAVTGPVPRPEIWWRERATLARWALRQGRVSEAYRMAKNHGLDERHTASMADAEWLAGWIALRFLGDADVAYGHFSTLFSIVRGPVSSARGAHWSARAATALHRPDLARTWHETAARYPATFYGQLSHAALYPGARIDLGSTQEPDDAARARFKNHELARVIAMLHALGQKGHMKPFLLRLADTTDTLDWRLLAIRLARDVGRNDVGLKIAKRALRDGQNVANAAFPSIDIPTLPTRRAPGVTPEAALTLAIVRQESAFQEEAKSRVGARGLMQLMPRTARKVSRQLRIPYARRKLTENPDYNLILGQAYMGGLLDQFDGAALLAIAAYNAGPSRARRWIHENGDPRAADVNAVDWIESIPFDETRNYVQRVLEGLHVYRMALGGDTVAFEPELPNAAQTLNN